MNPNNTPEKPIQILVIDDDSDQLFLFETLIGCSIKCEITTHTDPHKALEILKQKQFQIVICDVLMPSLNGEALLQEAKSFSDAKFIMLTASREDKSEELKNLGAKAVCNKNNARKELISLIKHLIA